MAVAMLQQHIYAADLPACLCPQWGALPAPCSPTLLPLCLSPFCARPQRGPAPALLTHPAAAVLLPSACPQWGAPRAPPSPRWAPPCPPPPRACWPTKRWVAGGLPAWHASRRACCVARLVVGSCGGGHGSRGAVWPLEWHGAGLLLSSPGPGGSCPHQQPSAQLCCWDLLCRSATSRARCEGAAAAACICPAHLAHPGPLTPTSCLPPAHTDPSPRQAALPSHS